MDFFLILAHFAPLNPYLSQFFLRQPRLMFKISAYFEVAKHQISMKYDKVLLRFLIEVFV